MCVAGANAPAFVERRFQRDARTMAENHRQGVSPGLTPRPSLSASRRAHVR